MAPQRLKTLCLVGKTEGTADDDYDGYRKKSKSASAGYDVLFEVLFTYLFLLKNYYLIIYFEISEVLSII